MDGGSARASVGCVAVAEWTTDLERNEQRRRKQFMLLSAGGLDEDERQYAGFDLATFTPDFELGKAAAKSGECSLSPMAPIKLSTAVSLVPHSTSSTRVTA